MTALYVLLAAVLTLPIVTTGYYSKKNLKGALLCFALSIPAYYIGKAVPVMGGPVVGILLGMLIATFWKRPESFGPGIKETSKRVLQGAIVLFGFQMDLSRLLEFGSKGIVLILSVIATALLAAFFIGKLMKVDSQAGTLIGVGTAICGGSAIAAVAPVIKADEKKVASAISTIFIFNVLAVFIFPAVGHTLGFDDVTFGMWAGSAINDTSSVVAAGFTYSDAAGGVATVIKLIRTLMIVPVTLTLALIESRKNKDSGDAFNLAKVFPWFVVGFIAACVVNTAGVVPAEAAAFWGKTGKFLIITAMTAIGMGTNLRELIRYGKRPILLGMCCSVTTAIVSLLILNLL